MWLKKINASKETDVAEKLRYSRYYEHDGILRAYANRAMVLAFLCIPITMLALAFAVYVRLQPPTVIRVDENGLATVLGATKPAISVTQGAGSEPSEFEKRAFVRLFLERYLNFAASNVSRNWADSLNMMTANLRRDAERKHDWKDPGRSGQFGISVALPRNRKRRPAYLCGFRSERDPPCSR